MPRLFLASRSPRRAELLRQIEVPFEVLDVEVEEQPRAGEAPRDYVLRVARDKTAAGLAQVGALPGAVVLGADTEVVLDDAIFGKPADAAAAADMLRRLSARRHQVLSALWCMAGRRRESALCVSSVEFAPLDEADIAAYVATGEPFGKAGAYAVQGRAAAFIRRLEGSHSGVMGLPLHETAMLLRHFGVF